MLSRVGQITNIMGNNYGIWGEVGVGLGLYLVVWGVLKILLKITEKSTLDLDDVTVGILEKPILISLGTEIGFRLLSDWGGLTSGLEVMVHVRKLIFTLVSL